MDKYILELVESNERVILPDLGAFLSRKGKTKQISFNEFLKFNDGLVVKYIAEKENLNNRDATKKVEEYVSRIRETLDKGSPYQIKGLGELRKNDRGRIDFYLEDQGKPPVQPMEKEEVPGKNVEIGKEETDKKEEVKKADARTGISGNNVSSAKTSSAVQFSTSSASDRKITEATEKPEGKKRKRFNWLVVLILLLALVIAGGVIYRNEVQKVYHKVMDSVISKNRPSRRDLLKTEPPVVEMEEPVDTLRELESAEPVEQEKAEPLPASMDEHYHIITGSFMNENFADKYMAKMISMGYQPTILRHRDNFYSVSIKSFSDKDRALKELTQVRQKIPRAWLLYY